MRRGLQSIHRGRSHALALLLMAAACGSGDEPASPSERASEQAIKHSAATQRGKVVTLITGDRITLRELGGQLAPLIEPGPGRTKLAFQIEKSGDEIMVVPSDVAELVAKGGLDRALFNVTRLLAEGYGDADQRETPLLITGMSKGQQSMVQSRGQLASAGLTVTRSSSRLGMMAVKQHKDSSAARAALTSLASLTSASAGGAATKIWLDQRRKPLLDHSVPQIGAPAAYARGLTGTGVKVAVLDTGVDAGHPDLAGKIAASETFVPDGMGPEDHYGHGTHVASIVAGSGAASSGSLHGVAPGAQILNGRVCDEGGSCYDSDIIAGMEWAVDQGARVINLSLGGPDAPGIDPLEEAVNTLSQAHDVLFVIAAGNVRRAPVSSPGSAEAALAVGAVDENDELASFSSRGPRLGDRAIKPDLTAPGVFIVAARAAGTDMGSPIDELYTSSSGTSMATPHVAGAAALLLQQHPSWTYGELKAALMATAQPRETLTVYDQGAGRVDVDRATAQQVHATPASISFAPATFPHDDDPVQTQVVRYRNEGGEPITLTLAASLRASSSPPVAGLVSVSPSTLVVPAGGFAEATLRLDTRGEAAASLYGGALVATSGATRLSTPIGVDIEAEVYDLKVVMLDPDGQPTAGFVSVRGLGPPGSPPRAIFESFVLVEGARTFRVPVGTYTVSSEANALLIAPRVAVSADTAVVMDERKATPQQITLPEGGHQLDTALWEYVDLGNQYAKVIYTLQIDFPSGEIGEPAPAGEIHSSHFGSYQATDGRESAYNIARSVPDHFVSGWKKTFKPRDFARMEYDFSASPGLLVHSLTFPLAPRQTFPTASFTRGHAEPFHRTEHLYGEGYLWAIDAETLMPWPDFPDNGDFVGVNNIIRSFPAGKTHSLQLNKAPFGPGFYDRTLYSLMPDRNGAPRQVNSTLMIGPTMLGAQLAPSPNAFSYAESGYAKLYRDGALINEKDYAADWALVTSIPTAAATYRFEAGTTRSPDIFDLSTKVDAAWTFRAQGAAGQQILPLPTLRFEPVLDGSNQSDAAIMLLPIHIERPVGAPTPRIADAHVDVSFDDGANWRRVPVLRVGDRALAVVAHPRGASYVSLRGGARDVEGNAVEQTIVRAYGLAPRRR